jgi:very-short-patch-repair endonuclease
VVDFCCLKQRLVIEVDGNQHGFDENVERDEVRTRKLEAQGYRVLRFTNREGMTSIDVVLDTIFAALGPTPPTPNPSPQGGGEIIR